MTKIMKGLFISCLTGILLGTTKGTGWTETVKTNEIVWPADKVQFKEVMPGISKAVLWENPSGAYAALTRFAPNVQNPVRK